MREAEKVVAILDEAKKAVHAGSASLNPDGDFMHAMSLDGENYVVSIEKYVPLDQRIKQYAKLLEDACNQRCLTSSRI